MVSVTDSYWHLQTKVANQKLEFVSTLPEVNFTPEGRPYVEQFDFESYMKIGEDEKARVIDWLGYTYPDIMNSDVNQTREIQQPEDVIITIKKTFEKVDDYDEDGEFRGEHRLFTIEFFRRKAGKLTCSLFPFPSYIKISSFLDGNGEEDTLYLFEYHYDGILHREDEPARFQLRERSTKFNMWWYIKGKEGQEDCRKPAKIEGEFCVWNLHGKATLEQKIFSKEKHKRLTKISKLKKE